MHYNRNGNDGYSHDEQRISRPHVPERSIVRHASGKCCLAKSGPPYPHTLSRDPDRSKRFPSGVSAYARHDCDPGSARGSRPTCSAARRTDSRCLPNSFARTAHIPRSTAAAGVSVLGEDDDQRVCVLCDRLISGSKSRSGAMHAGTLLCTALLPTVLRFPKIGFTMRVPRGRDAACAPDGPRFSVFWH